MKLKIQRGIPIPDWKQQGQLDLVYAPLFAKMRVGDSIKLKDDRELLKIATMANKYSRRYKKNLWAWRTTRVNEYRIWRIK